MVDSDRVEECHVCFEDLDGESCHDGGWDDDFLEGSVEAFVQVRATSSVLQSFDNCMFNVYGEFVVSVV